MNSKFPVKPPVWFWIVNILALIWNFFGILANLGTEFMTDEMKEAMDPEQLNLLENTPAWATAAFTIAVWGGFVGCIALLLRKKWARFMFLLSMIGILIQITHSFFMTNASEVYGTVQGLLMPFIIMVIGILLLFYSRHAHKKHWLS